MAFRFELDKAAPNDGYIVQEISFKLNYTTNAGAKTDVNNVFWEAWFVKKGETKGTINALLGFTDQSSEPPHPGTCGKAISKGEIRFFLKTVTGDLGDPASIPAIKTDPKTGFGGKNQEPLSGILPSTKTEPAWWKNAPDNKESVGKSSVTDTWSDPKVGPPFSNLVVTP